MGVWNNLGGLLGGSGRRTVPLDLLPGEQEVLRVVGSARPGLASVGGELVLTTMRVCFLPWNTRDLASILAWALPKAGGTKLSGLATNAVQRGVDGAARSLKGPELVSVEPGSRASVFKPPTVVVRGADGVPHEFGVLAGIGSPNFAARNVVTRDEFVTAAARARL